MTYEKERMGGITYRQTEQSEKFSNVTARVRPGILVIISVEYK